MRYTRLAVMVLTAILFIPAALYAADGITVPSLNLGVKQASNPQEVVGALQVLFILTILAIAPSIIIMMTVS